VLDAASATGSNDAVAANALAATRVPSPTAAGVSSGGSGEIGGLALEEAVLSSSNAFYKWHAELEAAVGAEADEGYSAYGTALERHAAVCSGLLGKVRAASAPRQA
jgi:hypothetical protein